MSIELQTVLLAIACGIVLHVVAIRLSIPSILLFLAGGVALGKHGLGLVRPDSMVEILRIVVAGGIAVILFEGGLSLRPKQFLESPVAIRNLILMGMPVTVAGGTLAAHFLGGLAWRHALLFGALVSVTGPTVIGPLLRNLNVSSRADSVLRWEAIWADCIGAIGAVVVLEYVTAEIDSPLSTLAELSLRVGIGAAAGIAVGAAAAWGVARLSSPTSLEEHLPQLMTLAVAFLSFAVGESLRHESGVAAVAAAGFVFGRSDFPGLDEIRRFKDVLTVLLIGSIFVLLAANLDLPEMAANWKAGAAVAAVLVVIVRPLAVAAGTWRSKLTRREKVFAAVIAPRGIIAAGVAAYCADVLAERGDPGGRTLQSLVFMVIAATVVLSAVLAAPLSRFLKLARAERHGILIVGANALGIELGKRLREAGLQVRIVDVSSEKCLRARQAGLEDVHDSAFDPRVLEEAWDADFGTLVALTENDHVNVLVAEAARRIFRGGHVILAPITRGESLQQQASALGPVSVLGFPGGVAAAALDIDLGRRVLVWGGSGWDAVLAVDGHRVGRPSDLPDARVLSLQPSAPTVDPAPSGAPEAGRG